MLSQCDESEESQTSLQLTAQAKLDALKEAQLRPSAVFVGSNLSAAVIKNRL